MESVDQPNNSCQIIPPQEGQPIPKLNARKAVGGTHTLQKIPSTLLPSKPCLPFTSHSQPASTPLPLPSTELVDDFEDEDYEPDSDEEEESLENEEVNEIDYIIEEFGSEHEGDRIPEVRQYRSKLRDYNALVIRNLRENEIVRCQFNEPNLIVADSEEDWSCSSDDGEGSGRLRRTIQSVGPGTNFNNFEWRVGMRFNSREDFKSAVTTYSITQGRNLSVCVSHKGRDQRLGYKCVEGCPFMLYGSWELRRNTYIVKSVHNTHSCTRDMNWNRQMTSEWVAKQFLDVFKERPHWPAKEIVKAVKDNFMISIKKTRAYKIKKAALKKLHGTMYEHYNKVGKYVEALKQSDPDSTFELEVVPNVDDPVGPPVFNRLFICFNGLRVGLVTGCPRILALDGCFLKTFLGGQLLTAIGRDANGQMYPLAWAVVNCENNESWYWFLSHLKKQLEGTEGDGWTFISDQQKGLQNAVPQIFPRAEHRNCARHVYANWQKKHKGDDLKSCFWKAVYAYDKVVHNDAILEMRNLSPQAANDFLNKNPSRFCRSWFNTITRCEVVVSNMAETFNSYIIEARQKHLIPMLEQIRNDLMVRIVEQKRIGRTMNTDICPNILKLMEDDKIEGKSCTVRCSSDSEFQVTHVTRSYSKGTSIDDYIVDIVDQTCSCRKWNLTGIPCPHACAVANELRVGVETCVNACYKRDKFIKSYDVSIKPLLGERHWPEFDFPMLPPPIKIATGRPKKNRRKDPHETKKKGKEKLTRHGQQLSCTVCKSTAHTKRKCPHIGDPSFAPAPKRGRGRPPIRVQRARIPLEAAFNTSGRDRGRGGGRGLEGWFNCSQQNPSSQTSNVSN